MLRPVLLAPVPYVHLASWAETPSLQAMVAFGSSKSGLSDLPVGIDVYIHASQSNDPRHLRSAGWKGRLGGIVPAVERGLRSGKHPNPSVRPPTAEAGDGPFLMFWEVENLQELVERTPLAAFKGPNGKKAYPGSQLQWPVAAYLQDNR
jgi:hypothetical protein